MANRKVPGSKAPTKTATKKLPRRHWSSWYRSPPSIVKSRIWMLWSNFNIPFVIPLFKATYRCRIGQVLVLFPLNPVSHVFLNQIWENNRKSCNVSRATFPCPQPGVRQQCQGGRKSVAMSRTWLLSNSEENCWDAPTAPAESFLWLDLWVCFHMFFLPLNMLDLYFWRGFYIHDHLNMSQSIPLASKHHDLQSLKNTEIHQKERRFSFHVSIAFLAETPVATGFSFGEITTPKLEARWSIGKLCPFTSFHLGQSDGWNLYVNT